MKNIIKIDKVICLNLDNRKENYIKIEQKLKKEGFVVISQKGIDGNIIIESKIKNDYKKFVSPFIKWNNKRKAKLAIFLSHLLIWENIENDYVLIIEDDILIKENVKKNIENFLNKIEEYWDIVYLGHAGNLSGEDKEDYVLANNKILKDTNHGMFAYVINPKSVKKIINLITPIFKIRNIDWVLREKYANNKDKGIVCIYKKESIIEHDFKIPSERLRIDKNFTI